MRNVLLMGVNWNSPCGASFVAGLSEKQVINLVWP